MLITFILSFYDRVRFYLVSCQVLRPQSMWKDSISPAYEGNTFMVDMWKKTLRVRDDRRRLTVVRSLAYVQSYVHSPYMYTVLRCPANRWGRTITITQTSHRWQLHHARRNNRHVMGGRWQSLMLDDSLEGQASMLVSWWYSRCQRRRLKPSTLDATTTTTTTSDAAIAIVVRRRRRQK